MFTASWAFTEQIYGQNPRFEEPGVAMMVIVATLLMVVACTLPGQFNRFGHGLGYQIKKEVK